VKEARLALAELNGKVAAQGDKLRAKSDAALAKNDLPGAVAALRSAQQADPEDAKTKASLKALRPRIFAAVKQMHRKGIDDYVKGDLDAAIDVWEQALEMDPSDPDGIKRDLDKARKLKDMKEK
jgi:tetratricopeptide (TPR) repeat protein